MSGQRITSKDIARAPAMVHGRGTLGPGVVVDFTLYLVPTLISLPMRGTPMPTIRYETQNFRVYGLELLEKRRSDPQKLRFDLPRELRDFAGPSTRFNTELFVGTRLSTTGFRRFERGAVALDVDFGA